AVLLGGSGRLAEPVAAVLAALDADVRRPVVTAPGAAETAAPTSAGMPVAAEPGTGNATPVTPSGAVAADATPNAASAATIDREHDASRDPSDHVRPRHQTGDDATATEPATSGRFGALIFDATAITTPEALQDLYSFFQPYARSLMPCGR